MCLSVYCLAYELHERKESLSPPAPRPSHVFPACVKEKSYSRHLKDGKADNFQGDYISGVL